MNRSHVFAVSLLALFVAMPVLAGDTKHAAEEADTTRSASLAGVSRWEDAEPADLVAEATYVLPGLIRANYGLDDLRTVFGAKNVKLAELDGAEGETSPGVVLFDGDPARRAELFFRDEQKRRGIDSVRVRAERSRWRLDNGAHVGMTLAELVAANGKPISFGGLDWDYGGNISDWHGGKLQPKPEEPTRTVQLGHADGATGYPLSEGSFRSDDKRYPNQGKVLRVDEIRVLFPGAGD